MLKCPVCGSTEVELNENLLYWLHETGYYCVNCEGLCFTAEEADDGSAERIEANGVRENASGRD